MADLNLLFRQGTLEALKESTKIAGSINFTTDEPAIYIDVLDENSNTVRKRIGDLIVVKTVDELMKDEDISTVADGALVGDWSTSALYYVENDNALLKFVKYEDGTTKWQQINVSADAELTNLTSRVGVLETSSETQGNAIADHEFRVSSLESSLNGTEGGANGLIADVSTLKESNNVIAPKVKTLEQNVSTLQTGVSGNTDNITAQGNRISDLEGVVGNADSGLVKDVAGHGTRISVLEALVGSSSESGGETIVSKVDQNATDISELKTSSETQSGQITNIENILNDGEDGEPGLVSKVSTNAEDIAAVEEVLNGDGTEAKPGLVATVADHTESIGQINTDIGVIQTNLESKASNDTVSALIQTVADNKTAQESATNATNARVSTLETTVGDSESGLVKDVADNKNSISELQTNLENYATKDELETAEETLNTTIVERIHAANAMTFVGKVSAWGDLPVVPVVSTESTIHIGDTYISTTTILDGELESGSVIYAGDLLVASGVEENGVITSGLSWIHVQTGYIQAHESKMKLDADTNTINLTSFAAAEANTGDLGTVAITSEEGSNITIASSVVEDATNSTGTITLGLTWGSF